jgi:hypothetical protein
MILENQMSQLQNRRFCQYRLKQQRECRLNGHALRSFWAGKGVLEQVDGE